MEFGSNNSVESSDDDDSETTGSSSSSSSKQAAAAKFGELFLKKDEPSTKREASWLRPEKAEPEAKKDAAESAAQQVEAAEANDQTTPELSIEQSRQTAEEYLDQRAEALAAEHDAVPDNSAEAVQVAASEAFIADMQDKMDEDSSLAPEDAATASAENIIQNLQETTPGAPPETGVDTEEDDPANATPPTATGGGTTPPIPPTPPPAAGGAMPPPLGFGGHRPYPMPLPQPGVQPNAAPYGSNITPQELAHQVRQGESRGLVVGGLLGYAYGRRRGRIRTEKRLLPVQEAQQKDINRLQKVIAAKEQEVATAAAEKATLTNELERKTMLERLRPVAQKQAERPAAPIAKPIESLPLPPSKDNEQARRQKPMPAAELAPAAVVSESFRAKPEASPAENHVEFVKKMTSQELLLTSEKVLIDGTSLRTIYEARHLTEPGLRRILVEHFAGHDIKKALNQELLVKELTYERDPKMRDTLAASYAASHAATSATSVTAPMFPTAPQPESNPVPAPQSIRLPDGRLVGTTQKSSNKAAQIAFTAWITVVVVLAVIAAVLILR